MSEMIPPVPSEGRTVDRAADEPKDFLDWLETAQTFMSEQEKYEGAVQYGRDCEAEIAVKDARLQEYEAALQEIAVMYEGQKAADIAKYALAHLQGTATPGGNDA